MAELAVQQHVRPTRDVIVIVIALFAFAFAAAPAARSDRDAGTRDLGRSHTRVRADRLGR